MDVKLVFSEAEELRNLNVASYYHKLLFFLNITKLH
jgi:hypothetical protein